MPVLKYHRVVKGKKTETFLIQTTNFSGPTTPTFSRMSPRKVGDRAAKSALRAIIPEEHFEDSWAWALKCYQVE